MEDKQKHFLGNVAQKAIIERDGVVLVCRGVGDTVWEFPGGRLHTGESPVDGIAREIKEELNLALKNIRPLSILSSFHYKSNMHQVFIAYTSDADGEVKVDETEVEEIKWVSREELSALPMFDDCEEAKKAFLESSANTFDRRG